MLLSLTNYWETRSASSYDDLDASSQLSLFVLTGPPHFSFA